MSVLGIRNADNLFTLLNQAIAAPRRTGESPLFRPLHVGEAEVGIWPLPGADEHSPVEVEYWSGKILHDSEKVIALDINGTEHTWLKSDRITIKYGDVTA